jgi:hypothetical protein
MQSLNKIYQFYKSMDNLIKQVNTVVLKINYSKWNLRMAINLRQKYQIGLSSFINVFRMTQNSFRLKALL